MQKRTFLGLTAAAVLCLGLQGSAAPAFPAGFLSSFRWVSGDPLLGGLSGIEVLDGGTRFVVISDRGSITDGKFRRNEKGQITGIDAAPMRKLKGDNGEVLKPVRSDSEGLAIAADGTIFVSFEGEARVQSYASLGSSAKTLPRAEAFRKMKHNSSLEPLAIDAKGRLFTLAEGLVGDTKPSPVYVFANGAWSQHGTVTVDGQFRPVAADFGPDGRFYLLERQFLGLGGFASRVRAFVVTKQGFGPPETVLETPPGLHDNLEGLAVWQDAAGDIRLTMVSDDNFRFFQRQEVVEYLLPVDATLNSN